MVAWGMAAERNLFFIGARRKISSVRKGILVNGACQWRPPRKNTAAKKHSTAASPSAAQHPLVLTQCEAADPHARNATLRARRRVDQCGWRAAQEGGKPATRRPRAAAR